MNESPRRPKATRRDSTSWLRIASCRDERGVTLVEVTVVMLVGAILMAAAAPTASRTLDRARVSRAVTDAAAIRSAIHNFMTDFTTFVPFTTTGGSGGSTVEMLVSDGDIPDVSSSGSGDWDDPVKTSATPFVDYLERHLVTNGVSYNTGTTPCTATNCWRGAYINGPVDPDPWGNRYAVNVEFLRTSTTNDVFVISAGPDEEIDSSFTVNGARPGDDDIINVIRRDPGKTVP